jgi:hypothetical protein
MRQAPGIMPGGQVKGPRLVSVEGREIVGPGFSVGRRVCVAQSEYRNKSGIRQSGPVEKTTAPGTVSEPRWCPPGLTRTQRRQVQKLRAKEIQEKAQEEERNRWFNQERPMKRSGKTWKEKRIEREEKGEGSGEDCDLQGREGLPCTEINMVFELPKEFHLPEDIGAQLDLGAERAVFEKPELLGQHMRALYIKGHLDGMPINRMLVDGGACINIMPWSLFSKLGHKEEELSKTNTMLIGFSGEASDAKGIISKELMVSSKTVPTAFFVGQIQCLVRPRLDTCHRMHPIHSPSMCNSMGQ